jgi:hypothetical protein
LAGRGGAQHKYLQEIVRRWAEANGWRVEIEKSILDGLGSVDVALERDDVSVACEISVSSTTEYEIGNIRKCLAAGFSRVVLVAAEQRVRTRMMSAVSQKIELSDSERVEVLSPEDLFRTLEQLAPLNQRAEQTTRGYKVKLKASQKRTVSTRVITQTVVNAMRRLRGPK